jgi:hypothetical protein
MPTPSPTRKDYGDDLIVATALPKGTINVDGFGLAQAQQSFTVDSSDPALGAYLASFADGESYPYGIGINLKSYKVSASYGKGGVATLVVDYMGVRGSNGYTKPQVTGIATSTAQPIEAHPNFTKVTAPGAGGVVLAGYPPSNLVVNNKPIFVQSTDAYATWTFRGFGLRTDGEVNIKAGIRQYLAPLATLRGQIFLSGGATSSSATFLQSVGKRLTNADVGKLVQPSDLAGALESAEQNYALLSAANAECIGNPDNPAAIKVTYDIMVGGEIGWDVDIYGLAPSIL